MKGMLEGFITSFRPQAPPQNPASLSTDLMGYSAANAGPPPGPLRLDASFNARSPSNPMTWEIDTSTSNIGPLLTQQHVFQQPLPPTIPQPADFNVQPNDSGSFAPGPSVKRSRGLDGPRRDLPALPNYRAPPHPVSMCKPCTLSDRIIAHLVALSQTASFPRPRLRPTMKMDCQPRRSQLHSKLLPKLRQKLSSRRALTEPVQVAAVLRPSVADLGNAGDRCHRPRTPFRTSSVSDWY